MKNTYIANMKEWVSEKTWSKASNAQKEALNGVASRWEKCFSPFRLTGIGSDLYLFGQVGSYDSPMMWLGIEQDGYTHS